MTDNRSELEGPHVDEGTSDVLTTAPPLRPAPPLAKRLNRNALTVAAALAGITVLTVLVVTRPARPGPTGTAAVGQSEMPPVPARPAFLDQPPRPSPAHSADTAHGTIGTGRDQPAREPRVGRAGEVWGGPRADSGVMLPVPPPIGEASARMPSPTFGSAGASGDGAGPSPRHEAYQAALTSSVLVGAQSGPHARPMMTPAPDADAGSDSPEAARALLRALSAAPAVTPPVGPAATGPGSSSDTAHGAPAAGSGTAAPALTALAGAPPPVATSVRLEAAGSPYTVRAGTVVPGLLVTGVNSDLPGEVLGQTSRDVYDSRTQHVLLLPKGSRLIGTYDNRSVGTGRLVVGWTRLILPDGRSMSLPRLAGTDAQGQAGLHDEVDHHFGRVYGAALLTSAITAGVQLSQPEQSGLYAVPSTRQVAAGALGQTMGDVALESARRGLDIPPTVVIRPGQAFNVFLAGDLVFPGPYETTMVSDGPP